MKIASGAGKSAKACGASPVTTERPGTPKLSALRAMRSARSGRTSIATALLAGSASIHSIATEPEPAPTSHSKFAAPRRERGKRDRADFALGDLPVVLEPVVGQAGRARQDARAAIGDDLERDRVQGGDVVEREALRLGRANALARAPHRLADRELRSPHAARGQAAPPASPAWRRPMTARECARRRCRCGMIASSGRPCSVSKRAILLAPAEPRRGERKGGGRRDRDHLVRPRSGASASRRRRRRTDRRWRARIPSGRAGLRSRRARSRSATARRIVSAFNGPASARWRLPPTTKSACATSRRAAGVRPSIPSSPMPTRPSQRSPLTEPPTEAPSPAHSRRHVGSERARAADRRRARRRGRSCRLRARRPILRRRRSRSASAASAAPRAWRAYLARERIDAVVDATHPFASRMSANAVAACRATDTPLVVFTRPPWTPQGRRPLDRGRDDGRGGRRSRGSARGRFSSRRAGCSSPPSRERRSIATSCGRSTGRRRSTPCPDCKLILARGPFSLADELALMQRRGDRGAGDQEQRRARDLRQDRSGARA